MLKLFEPFFEFFIQDLAVLVRKTPLAEKDATRDPIAGAGLRSVVTDAGGDSYAKDKKDSVIGSIRQKLITYMGQREPDIVFTHFPKDPNCEVCRMTQTTRTRCKKKTIETPPRNPAFYHTRLQHAVRWAGTTLLCFRMLQREAHSACVYGLEQLRVAQAQLCSTNQCGTLRVNLNSPLFARTHVLILALGAPQETAHHCAAHGRHRTIEGA